jgi:hypothetical protein
MTQGEVRDPAPSSTTVNPVPHEHARFDWVTDIDTSIGPVPSPCDFHPTTPPQPVRIPPAPTDCATAAYMPAAPVPISPNPIAPINPVPSALNDLTPTTHVDAVITLVPNKSIDPAIIALDDPTPITPIAPITPVLVANVLIDTTPAAPTGTSPIVPIIRASPPLIAHGPRDISGLRLDARNPWGSIRHRHHRSRPVRTYHRDSHPGPNPSQYSHSHPPHARPVNSQPHLHSDSRQPKPPKLNLRSKSHWPAESQPSVHYFQIIQHPHGISSTKPKITKTIPTSPILSIATQEHSHVSHCTCGAILSVHRMDRGRWRSVDSRWRFGTGFHRRFRRRFWDQERGHSHFRGG